jgi:DNA (cytosine-5)-methyltransferase 1
MRRIRSTRTRPELELSEALHKRSISFEANCTDLPGKPDIVIRNKRFAIFVDGEFWHGGQWRQRGLNALVDQFPDAAKRERWIAKIKRNCARDFCHTAQLLNDGWTVIRFWAGDVQRNPTEAADYIIRALADKIPVSAASSLPSRHVGEFFAGIGLARKGLEQDGWIVRFANDNAPDKLEFYKANFRDSQAHLDERDIHEIKAEEVPSVSLATACFPCTDLSLAGAQRGLEPGTESSAYLKFTALLLEMGDNRPPFVLLENVFGMIHSRDGVDFTICLEKLHQAGYTVDPFVVDAKWFVPQSRPRLFVVAIRDDLRPDGHFNIDQFATATVLRPDRLAQFLQSHPTIPWSLRSLPPPPSLCVRLKDVLERLPNDDPRWWPKARAQALYKQMSPAHRKLVRQMMKSKRAKYGTVFRRMRNEQSTAELRTDGLAGCLRTPKGGSARQILLHASNGKFAVRLLTPLECARLMGAGDIKPPKSMSVNKSLFAFGDGVCVPVIHWIAEHYLTPLATELMRGCVLRLTRV